MTRGRRGLRRARASTHLQKEDRARARRGLSLRDWYRSDRAPDMFAANRSPKSSPGPGGSVRAPQLGENISVPDCVCEENCTRAGPGPRTTVSPEPWSRPPLVSVHVQKRILGCTELVYAEVGSDLVLQSRCSHVGPLMKTGRLELRQTTVATVNSYYSYTCYYC